MESPLIDTIKSLSPDQEAYFHATSACEYKPPDAGLRIFSPVYFKRPDAENKTLENRNLGMVFKLIAWNSAPAEVDEHSFAPSPFRISIGNLVLLSHSPRNRIYDRFTLLAIHDERNPNALNNAKQELEKLKRFSMLAELVFAGDEYHITGYYGIAGDVPRRGGFFGIEDPRETGRTLG